MPSNHCSTMIFRVTLASIALVLLTTRGSGQHTENSVAGNRRSLVSTENFDWKAYLFYNKDLPAQGINTEAAAVSHFLNVGHREGRRYNKVMPGMENFDWRAYLQLNPDLFRAGLNTEDQVWQHYRVIGIGEGRHSQTTSPLNSSYAAGLEKLRNYIQAKRDLEEIPVEKTNFVLYHLEDIESSSNSIAVTFNNVKLFASAVRRNDLDVFAAQNAFYWINVASVSYNPLADLFPTNNPNVALVNWEIDGGVMNSHIDTLTRLSPLIQADFSAVFFLSSGVRGPFEKRGQGDWMVPYRTLLEPENVAVVGATVACSPSAHIQTHFFAIKSVLIPHMLASVKDVYLNMVYWTSLDEFFQTELSEIARKQGYEIASMMHYKRLNTPTFRGDCNNNTHLQEHSTHLASMREWCHVAPSEVNFVRWSGESLGAKGYLCNKAIGTDTDSVSVMEVEMEKVSAVEPHLGLELSEPLTGGMLYDLYHMYNDDFWRNRNISVSSQSLLAANSSGNSSARVETSLRHAQSPPKVCFLVRTSKNHDPALTLNSKAKYGMIQLDLEGHIRSLLRQTNPNWQAFFFLNEKPVFAKRLRALLAAYEDPRLHFLPIEAKHRMKDLEMSSEQVNFALGVVQQRTDCRWISLTSASNAYGSEVVDRVMRHAAPAGSTPPDILFVAADSKYFAKQDYAKRQETRWDQRCIGIEGMLRHNLLAYTIQPVPYPGRVDFAATFFSRDRLARENVKFDMASLGGRNETFTGDRACDGPMCEDGSVIQHLVRSRLWSYARLALDGLKTIVFLENSPTLCIASGNVWFDYPQVANVGCISHKTLYLLAQKDTSRSAFDWPTFHDGDRLCLRLSNIGFTSRMNAARKAEVLSKGTKSRGSRALLAIGAPHPDTEDEAAAEDASASTPDEHSAHGALTAYAARTGSRALQEVPEPLPEDFDWREYLAQNPDLQADGIVFRNAAIEHYLYFGRKEGRSYYEQVTDSDIFDWRAYLELNPDVPVNRRTEAGAFFHYKAVGRAQRRPCTLTEPVSYTWDTAVRKLERYVRTQNSAMTEVSKRNLVIYHVEDPGTNENSLDVLRNNIRVFTAAVAQHTGSAGAQAFYLFNIVSTANNPLVAEIPTVRANVAVVKWGLASSDMYVHLRTLNKLSPEVYGNFSAVFFTNSGVRGPLIYTRKGEWLGEFRKLLDANDIGLAGTTVSCRGGPHVQTHFFALRASLIPTILSEYKRYYRMTPWVSVLDHFEVEMSSAVVRAGYQVTSKLTQKRLPFPYFERNCTSHGEFGIPFSYNWDYRSWCEIELQDVIFVRWGGEPLGAPADRYLCEKTLDMTEAAIAKMEDTMVDIGNGGQKVQFSLPESPYGGILHDLFRQYREELWRERLVMSGDATEEVQAPQNAPNSKVCFLVRTSIRDDPQRSVRSKPEMKEMDLASLIQSLIRQTDPNWQAFFFITDQVPFENRLRKILNNFADKRLKYISLDHAHRPAFTRVDAGYTSTDYVTNIVKNKQECRYISITNADNVYGSAIVSSVLHYPKDPVTRASPDMLLAPLDSRNFAEHDYHKRQESELSDRCKGIHAMLEYNLLAYTTQPIPFLGRVDLAAVFLDRRKFAAENVLFGNFTNPKSYPCVGCQDGYLTQYLVRSRRWEYVRMPLDGLRSIVFHGPSPTWCVAGGNVWFDYPHVNKVGCFTHETVSYLKQIENLAAPTFDWENFYAVGRKCLRLSKTGFLNKAIGK